MAPAHMAAAQQMAIQNSFLAQQRQRQAAENLRGQCMLKLVQFGEQLSSYPVGAAPESSNSWFGESVTLTDQQGTKTKDDLSYWNAFVERFFAPEGVFRHALHTTDTGEPEMKQYEITFPAIARYFHTHFGSGVRQMQLVLDKSTIDRSMPQEGHLIENPRASLVYWFETGSHVSSWAS